MRNITKHIRKGMASKEGIMNIFMLFLLLIYARFSCLAKSVVLFSTRLFSSGNTTLILGGLRVPTRERFNENHFHYLALGQDSAVIHSVISFKIVLFWRVATVEG